MAWRAREIWKRTGKKKKMKEGLGKKRDEARQLPEAPEWKGGGRNNKDGNMGN